MKTLGSIPNWVKGAIGLVTGIVGLVVLFQGNRGLVLTVATGVFVFSGWLGCLYLAFGGRSASVADKAAWWTRRGTRLVSGLCAILIPGVVAGWLVLDTGVRSSVRAAVLGQAPVEVRRALPILNEFAEPVGYEVLVVNENASERWVEWAELAVDAVERAPCSGNLRELKRYVVRLWVRGRLIEPDTGAVLHQIAGTVSGEPGERYMVEGFLKYSDNCSTREWHVEIRMPMNVLLPAKGRATIQLEILIDTVRLDHQERSGTWEARTILGGRESNKLVLVLDNGERIESSYDGAVAERLINSIVDNAPQP